MQLLAAASLSALSLASFQAVKRGWVYARRRALSLASFQVLRFVMFVFLASVVGVIMCFYTGVVAAPRILNYTMLVAFDKSGVLGVNYM